MKFLKQFLASCLGMVCAILISFVLLIAVLTYSLGSIDQKAPTVTSIPQKTALHLKFRGMMYDRVEDNPWKSFVSEIEDISLENTIEAIHRAKIDANISAIYLDMQECGISPASAEEIRNALIDFKTSGKSILAYAGVYTQQAYYIATVADILTVNPQGMLNFQGFAADLSFFKGTLDKLGVEMQIFKVGTYKSAVEPFTNTQMSDANREQTTAFLGSIWNHELSNISNSRNISIDSLNHLADEMMLFQDADRYLQTGLVDDLCYETEALNLLKSLCITDSAKKLSMVSVEDFLMLTSVTTNSSKNKVAVLFAEGEIVGDASSASNNQIVEGQVVSQLRKLRNNDAVKAVVFRVNSPGGSAYASDQIWKEVRLLNESKPVVISMGDYAASGGYYISSAASYIFAQPNTITGSIGIFGMIPNISGLAEKVGLTFDAVKTNKFSDMPQISRPMSDEEKALMQRYVERGYDTFLSRVLQGRTQLNRESLEKIAEGRVWTGEMALQLGLVDELGGMDSAIMKAASLAQITDYEPVSYPEKKSFFERMMDNSPTTPEVELLMSVPFLRSFVKGKEITMPVTEYLQARLPLTITTR